MDCHVMQLKSLHRANRYMKVIHYCMLIGLLASSLWLHAQRQPLEFERLSTDAGLSHNQVNCIFKDRQGFIWFGTFAGLDRYDGSDFKVFRNDPRDSTSLSEDFVERI